MNLTDFSFAGQKKCRQFNATNTCKLVYLLEYFYLLFLASDTPLFLRYIQLNKDLYFLMYLQFVRAIEKEIFNLTVRLT